MDSSWVTIELDYVDFEAHLTVFSESIAPRVYLRGFLFGRSTGDRLQAMRGKGFTVFVDRLLVSFGVSGVIHNPILYQWDVIEDRLTSLCPVNALGEDFLSFGVAVPPNLEGIF